MWEERTRLMFGVESLTKLHAAHVLVVGLGGVGAYAAEMLCRAGVGELSLIDADVVSESNINRQLIALHSTVGQPKTEVLAARLRDINPNVKLHIFPEFLRDERTLEVLQVAHYDFLVDAIDTLSPKVFLLRHAFTLGIPTVSSMGSGGKTDPMQVRICDISNRTIANWRTWYAKFTSFGCAQRHYGGFSPEIVSENRIEIVENEQNKRSNVGTVSYMPAVFGCFAASHVIRTIIGDN